MNYSPNKQMQSVLSALTLIATLALTPGCQGENGQQAQAAFYQMTAGETTQTPPRTARWVEEKRDRIPETPHARGQIYPDRGHAGMTNFRFDASLATDDIDTGRQLLKRWDFDGDGSWDMKFTKRSRVYYTYPDTGRFSPRLQVRDLSGRSDSCRIETIRIASDCPAPEFTMIDVNPNSQTSGETFSLEAMRGHRVVVWYLMPSK